MSRAAKVLVILTALLCLGVGGYAGQVWWAKRLATTEYSNLVEVSNDKDSPLNWILYDVNAWKRTPWCGDFYFQHSGGLLRRGSPYNPLWRPRRWWYENLKLTTGKDLSNDPQCWEAWLNTHPSIRWDAKQKLLVEVSKP